MSLIEKTCRFLHRKQEKNILTMKKMTTFAAIMIYLPWNLLLN